MKLQGLKMNFRSSFVLVVSMLLILFCTLMFRAPQDNYYGQTIKEDYTNFSEEDILNETDVHKNNLRPRYRNGMTNFVSSATTTRNGSDSIIYKDIGPKVESKDVESIQEERHQILKEGCEKWKSPTKSFQYLVSHPPSHFIVDDKYKLVYCSIPKVACTSWKSVFYVLAGKTNSTYDMSQYEINRMVKRQLKQLSMYSFGERDHILRTYTKFMFSRNPFSRILSAFQNKLSPNTTFPRAGAWQKSVGMRIIQKYRKVKIPFSQYDLQFSEFVKYIIDSQEIQLNKHWHFQAHSCRPCDFNYDILGHFETLNQDADYILNLADAEDVVTFPQPNHSSPTFSSQESILASHYEKVSNSDLKKLYQKYQEDFELFGYDMPSWIHDI